MNVSTCGHVLRFCMAGITWYSRYTTHNRHAGYKVSIYLFAPRYILLYRKAVSRVWEIQTGSHYNLSKCEEILLLKSKCRTRRPTGALYVSVKTIVRLNDTGVKTSVWLFSFRHSLSNRYCYRSSLCGRCKMQLLRHDT
jgi:hypothetical protein